jgi:hypothetical protein
MRNLFNTIIVSLFVLIASSCQRVEIAPSQATTSPTEVFGNRTDVLTAPKNFSVTNISNQDITFTWDGQEGEEGYILNIYSNEGTLIAEYLLDASVHQYTVNQGEGSFKALLKRVCDGTIISNAAETAATACCGSGTILEDIVESIIQNGQSACLSDYAVESYTLNSTQSVTQLTHTIYSASPDYLVIYGFMNTENGTPTTYSMIPMSNILTVNAATSMKHTLQLDFQGSAYCKVYFIPWNLANCSVL